MPLTHAFVLVFTVIVPIAGIVGYRRLLERLQAGIVLDRPALYRNTLLSHWALFAFGAGLWWYSGRPLSAIGVRISINPAFVVAVILTSLAIAMLIAQVARVKKAPQDRIDRYRHHFDKLAPIIPGSRSELAIFNLVSVTAGITEEFLWRGYLMWYLTQYLSALPAALIATVAFGLAHAYQGWAKVPQITLVGGAFMILYLITGSLLLPIVMHIAVDLLQGRLAYEISNRSNPGPIVAQPMKSK